MAENIAILTTTQATSSLGHLRRSVTQSLNPRGLLYRHDHLCAGNLDLPFYASNLVGSKSCSARLLSSSDVEYASHQATCIIAGYILPVTLM